MNWFRQTVPIPAVEAHKTAHIVLMNLAPAVAEEDYEGFCRAVNSITYNTYFKQKQIANQGPLVQELIIEASKRNDIDAFGMSSMGPMCYAFSRKSDSVLEWLEEKRLIGTIHSFWFTNAQNHPAIFEGIPK